MTINEAVRSGARDRLVTGDQVSHALAAGAEYYPAATWPKTQPLRDSVWRQLATELDTRVQYGNTDVSKISGGGGAGGGYELGTAFGEGFFGEGYFGGLPYGGYGWLAQGG